MKIRIKFAKYGTLKFIGHLDVMRFFQKAIRRAGIDIKYSEGFSPHQIMSFAAPLGVGMESMGEYLDIEVNSITSVEDMKTALNETMVDGIDVLSVKILPDSSKNAMASVAAAAYTISYKEGNFPIDDIQQKLADFYAKESIVVTKKTKKSTMDMDLKPGIFELKMDKPLNIPSDIDSDGDKQITPVIYILVDASSSGNIKPSMVLDAFCAYCNVELEPYSCQITRLETYTRIIDAQGEEKLVPLEEAGHE
ncbi:MAG: TIGR03936 family radical SAM-associated protein [Lachnospiraceae bacterium]|nr:TIGR03936 family radical SAM-associated protein [Lachnospiraceae bacterium]